MRLRWSGETSGAEGVEGGQEDEVGCGCGGVGPLLLWLVAGVWTGFVLQLPRRKGVYRTFLTLDSTSIDYIQDVVGFVS